MATQSIPHLELRAEQIGPLGLALGESTDAGGGTEPPGQIFIPLLKFNWFDERQTCKLVHDFLETGELPDWEHCPSWRAVDGYGRPCAWHCAAGGQGTPCAFQEPQDAEVWQKARSYVRMGNCLISTTHMTEEQIAELRAQAGVEE